MAKLRQDGCQSWSDVINHGRKASPRHQSPLAVVIKLIGLERVNKTSVPLCRSSEVLSNTEVVSLAGVVEASLSDGFKRWQSIAMPSNFVSEGSPVNEGEASRVDDALFKVLSSIATNLGEMRGAQVHLQQQSRPSRLYYRSWKS
ncbi:hypothetical protein QYF36_015611 [Acer negundo]|nr:hypothetical protein QYF36_015611 [Acer negundo]